MFAAQLRILEIKGRRHIFDNYVLGISISFPTNIEQFLLVIYVNASLGRAYNTPRPAFGRHVECVVKIKSIRAISSVQIFLPST